MDKIITTVLIVDDSLVYRHAIEDALKDEPDIKVIGSVRNGVKAMEFIAVSQPCLVTLDLEMPDLDGIETLKAIQQFNADHALVPGINVIMLSAHTKKGAESTMQALEMGAFDFITKSETTNETESIAALKLALIHRIHHMSSLSLLGRQTHVKTQPPSLTVAEATPFEKNKSSAATKIKAIVIGVSTGGPKALLNMLPGLCSKVTLPIFIVQHMPEKFTQSLAESLGKKCSHRVKEGTDGELVTSKTVYIAPGGRHMLLRKSGANTVISINDQPPENSCKPSVDILFRSIPVIYNGDAVAIVLTGMGTDGTKSVRALKREGVFIIAQDEETSVVWGMPGSAVATGLVDTVVPLMKIPDVVADYICRRDT